MAAASTTEIAIYPEGAGLSGAGFIWRVSIAEVAVDGPFSRFPGYDRHIMTIAGNGMMLEAEGHGGDRSFAAVLCRGNFQATGMSMAD